MHSLKEFLFSVDSNNAIIAAWTLQILWRHPTCRLVCWLCIQKEDCWQSWYSLQLEGSHLLSSPGLESHRRVCKKEKNGKKSCLLTTSWGIFLYFWEFLWIRKPRPLRPGKLGSLLCVLMVGCCYWRLSQQLYKSIQYQNWGLPLSHSWKATAAAYPSLTTDFCRVHNTTSEFATTN